VAQWPRIVVGPNALSLLKTQAADTAVDPFSTNNKALAEVCISMLATDTDGRSVIDYLAPSFGAEIEIGVHIDMYERALRYVQAQIVEHEAVGDAKLLSRYRELERYYAARKPIAQ